MNKICYNKHLLVYFLAKFDSKNYVLKMAFTGSEKIPHHSS